jgi:hypothetical protein
LRQKEKCEVNLIAENIYLPRTVRMRNGFEAITVTNRENAGPNAMRA